MSLLRINLILLLALASLLLNGCASLTGSGSAANEDWNNVPKPYIEGLKAARKGQSRQAIKLFKQTVESYPDFAAAYTNMGLQQLRLKDRKAARKSLQKAIEINPDNPVAYNHLGVIARLDGDFDSALKDYKKAIDLNPDYALAHLNLGILQDLYLYDLEQALEHYERYQSLLKKKDKNVAKWIIDIKRRIAKNKKS